MCGGEDSGGGSGSCGDADGDGDDDADGGGGLRPLVVGSSGWLHGRCCLEPPNDAVSARSPVGLCDSRRSLTADSCRSLTHLSSGEQAVRAVSQSTAARNCDV